MAAQFQQSRFGNIGQPGKTGNGDVAIASAAPQSSNTFGVTHGFGSIWSDGKPRHAATPLAAEQQAAQGSHTRQVASSVGAGTSVADFKMDSRQTGQGPFALVPDNGPRGREPGNFNPFPNSEFALPRGARFDDSAVQPMMPAETDHRHLQSVATSQLYSMQNAHQRTSDTSLTRFSSGSDKLNTPRSSNEFNQFSSQPGTSWADSSTQPSPVEDRFFPGSDRHGPPSKATSNKGSQPPSRAGQRNANLDTQAYPRQSHQANLPQNYSFTSLNNDFQQARGKAPPSSYNHEHTQRGLEQEFKGLNLSSIPGQTYADERRNSNTSLGQTRSFGPPNDHQRTVPQLSFNDYSAVQQSSMQQAFRRSEPPTPDDTFPRPFDSQLEGFHGSTRAYRSQQHSSRPSPPLGNQARSYGNRFQLNDSQSMPRSGPEPAQVRDRLNRVLQGQQGPYNSEYDHEQFDPQQQLDMRQQIDARNQLALLNIYSIQARMPNGGYGPYGSMQQIPQAMLHNQAMPPTPIKSEPPHGVRSARLDEFRSVHNKNGRKYQLKDIYGAAVEFSGDQHGSRFIQDALQTANSDEKQRIFEEILPNAVQLMSDVFGNYVVQKLFEFGDLNQKRILASKIEGLMPYLSRNTYGCRVVQKALENVLLDQQIVLVNELQPSVVECIMDQHGNHVIQKAIERLPLENIQFVVSAVGSQATRLSTQQFGCRVVQRLLERCNREAISHIWTDLLGSSDQLITDQYGNYVTQHIIEHGTLEDRAHIVDVVKAKLVGLSKQKFSSNVVERCIQHATDEQRSVIMHMLCDKNAKGENWLPMLVKDQYGNYVLQKLLATLNAVDHSNFSAFLTPEVYRAKYLENNCTKWVDALATKLSLVSSRPGAQEMQKPNNRAFSGPRFNREH